MLPPAPTHTEIKKITRIVFSDYNEVLDRVESKSFQVFLSPLIGDSPLIDKADSIHVASSSCVILNATSTTDLAKK